MAPRETERQAHLRKAAANSPELLQAARQLALLAISQQERALNPRETETLRRALTTAGGIVGWSENSVSDAGPVAEVSDDLLTLAVIGVDSLSADLAEERAQKQTETSRLTQAAAHARKLAASPRTKYPVEITYSYTTRDPSGTLITKTATITVTNEGEAVDAANSLDGSMESRTKLTDLMVIDLAERRTRLQGVVRGLPDFAKSSRWLLAEVIASLD